MSLADAEFILELLNSPGFLRFVGDKGVRTLNDARDYLRRGPLASYEQFGFGLSLVALRVGGTRIGICGLIRRDELDDVDIGFALLPDFCGQGYASEAAAAVLEEGWTRYGLERIVAITTPDNAASIAVLETIGLRFERFVTLPGDDCELKLFAADHRKDNEG